MDFEETFSLIVKFRTTQVLNLIIAYYRWNIKQMDVVTVYFNFSIDIILYIETSISYKIVRKVYLLKKTIYRLKQSTCQ